MGWDVLIFKLREPNTLPRDLDATKVMQLGSVDELRQAIDAIVPGIDWSVPDRGVVHLHDFWLTFDIGGSDRLSLGITVHGAGNPLPPIVALCKTHGWTAFDTTTAQFLDLDAPNAEGWQRFQRFRDAASGHMLEDDD